MVVVEAAAVVVAASHVGGCRAVGVVVVATTHVQTQAQARVRVRVRVRVQVQVQVQEASSRELVAAPGACRDSFNSQSFCSMCTPMCQLCIFVLVVMPGHRVNIMAAPQGRAHTSRATVHTNQSHAALHLSDGIVHDMNTPQKASAEGSCGAHNRHHACATTCRERRRRARS